MWYFEQKGVDNPERFLAQQVQTAPSPLIPFQQGEGNVLNPENQLSNLPPQDLSQSDMGTILNLVKLVYQYASENGGNTSELEKLVENMEQILEAK